jgi:hypothetical protein
MRNFFLRTLAICLVVAGSSLAHAQTTWSSVGPFVISEIKSDFSPSEGLVVVPPAGFTIPNPSSCATASGAGLVATNPSYKTLSAIILAAFLSGKQVRLWFANPSSCAVGRPAFVGVDVLN